MMRERKTNYTLLAKQVESIMDGIPYQTANLANAAAIIYHGLPDLNWAGFYLMEEGQLILGPFQGKEACILIPMGKGVCGTAAEHRKTILVKDVHEFPGHIACDSASQSEIVIPLIVKDQVIGVLDIDSPIRARFNEEDRAGLETIARKIEKMFETAK